jgi:acyl-CoA synthetase (AMP-forming)/AMP-acid ligase II
MLKLEAVTTHGEGPFRARGPDALIEIQTSGTTGKPKRIPIAERVVEASLRDGVRTAKGAVAQTDLQPKSSPTLMFGPLVHTSGTFNTLMSVFEVRPIVLFERFDAEKFRQALVRYRPKFAPMPPAAIKMMLDSKATREDFSSVLAVRVGTAPLPVDMQIAFEAKFGVPVLTTYGATEFMGVVTSWTLDDHRRFAEAKRGSAGRPGKGVQIRVVDPDTGAELAVEEQGVLEAKLDRVDGGRNWIRTTDLARIDKDGFLFILGRTDDAIIRGGFKVMAGKVADVLAQFAGVYDAIVVGRPDERLGEAPVAVIEPYPDAPPIDIAALKAFARERLTAYEVPARIHVVERLPRTVSDKVSRPEVKRLLDELGD